MKEAAELRSPTEMYFAQPLEVSSKNSSNKLYFLKARSHKHDGMISPTTITGFK